MNISAYDVVNNVNYNKTWINTVYRKLYSRELKHYKYYTILTRYEKSSQSYDYYICLYDSPSDNLKNKKLDCCGRTIKIPLADIWDKTSFKYREERTFNIVPELINQDDDSVIYGIDV